MSDTRPPATPVDVVAGSLAGVLIIFAALFIGWIAWEMLKILIGYTEQ